MTVEMINEFMDSMVRGTLTGICFAFWLLCMAGIWKWFIGVMKRALFYLFCDEKSSVLPFSRPEGLDGEQKKDEGKRQWKRQ